MFKAIGNFFNKINPFHESKKEESKLSDSKIVKTGQDALSNITREAPAKKFEAKPIHSEGWFSGITNFLRRKLHEWFKGKTPSKPEEIQGLLTSIGGKENELTTKYDAKLRTMHLKASDLLGKIKEAKGSRVKVQAKDKTISGFVFDEAPKDLEKTLEDLGILDSTYKGQVMEGPWTLQVRNGKTYLFAKTDYEMMKSEMIILEHQFSKNASLTTSGIQIPQGKNTTVVLGGGVCSYYESHHASTEAAAFLIRGIDVVLFEDKAEMESEANHHVMAARKAIYNYLSKDVGLDNNQIILKGMCFSSVPAVEFSAKKGGEIPVIIDQGYLDIKPVAVEMAANYPRPSLSNTARNIASHIVNNYFSEWNMDYQMNHLQELKGHLCVIMNENDEMIALEERVKMDNILKNMNYDRVVINNKAIRHAGPWYQDEQASKQLDKFLNNKFNNKAII